MRYAPKFYFFLLLLTLQWFGCSEDSGTTPMEEEPIARNWVVTHTIEELLTDFGGSEVMIDTIAIEGYVISSDSAGNINNQLYIRDASGAIGISVMGDNLYQSFPMGQEILLKCVGLRVDAISRFITLSDGGSLDADSEDEPLLSLDESESVSALFVNLRTLQDKNDLSNLVRVSGFEFPEEAVGKTLVQAGADTEWLLTDSYGTELQIFIDADAKFGGTLIPPKTGQISGILKENANGFVLLVRDFDDFSFLRDRTAPFVKKTFEYSGNTLPYQIMYPRGYDPAQSYPLVMFLHGAGERGTNNTSQMAYGPNTFGNYEARTNYPAIVIFPQCPSDVMWSRRIKYQENGVWIFEFPVEEKPNYAMEMAIELIRELIVTDGVDENRIYITGLSMGGIGTFEFLYYAPDLPAAAASIAGGHDPALLPSYGLNQNFWLFHGSNDGVVPPKYSRDMFARMQELDIHAGYTEASGRGHEWNYVLEDPTYLEWLFAQSKN